MKSTPILVALAALLVLGRVDCGDPWGENLQPRLRANFLSQKSGKRAPFHSEVVVVNDADPVPRSTQRSQQSRLLNVETSNPLFESAAAATKPPLQTLSR